MPRLVLAGLVLLIALLGAACKCLGTNNEHATAAEESRVLVLDASNFTEVVKQHPFIAVKFYASWCRHCQRLAPLYEKAAALLHAEAHDPPIVLAKMDASNDPNRALAIEHGAKGVPALKIIQDGGAVKRDYKGPLSDTSGIVSYLKRQAGPACAEIKSAEEGQRLVAGSEFLVVGVFPRDHAGDDELRSFISLANELQSEYEFKHTRDATFLPERPNAPLLDTTRPTIRAFKKFDEGFHDLHEFGGEAVKKFLDEVSIPHVVWYNKDPVQQEYLSKIFLDYPTDAKAFLFLDANSADADQEEVKRVYGELAKEHKGKGLRFVVANSEEGQEALEYFGARQDRLPSIIIQANDKKKYALEKAHTADMAAWLQDYMDGKAAEFLKSEPVPETNDGPVKIVVSDTLDTLVLNSGKNVLLELYAPWCGHCKRLAPILEEVAIELHTSNPDVIIAKMDATANDLRDERFTVKGYPTIYLVRSAAGEVIPFDGKDRTKEGIISFINMHVNAADQVKDAAASIESSTGPKDEL